jgi:hypothetical protein
VQGLQIVNINAERFPRFMTVFEPLQRGHDFFRSLSVVPEVRLSGFCLK